MYYISEEFNNACNDYVRTWHGKCVVNEGKPNEITLVNNVPQNCLGAMTWESSINADDALAMGQTGMDKLTMEVTMMNNYNLQGAKLHPYVGIEVNGETVWCPLGVFYVENVETDDIYFKQTVTAYDTMSILEEEFNEVDLGITFPISVKDLLQAIATRFNVGINVDTYTMLESADEYILQDNAAVYLIVDKTTDAIENAYAGSYRDYIGWMAGLYGCNAHMDRDGNIAFKYYVDDGVRITPNIIYTNGLTLKRGGTVTYTSLVSGTQENPVYPTRYTGNAITFTNPYITADDLEAIGDDILPITYHPCDIHYRGNPCIDVGDIVTVVDKNNTNYTAYVMQRTLSMTGGLDDNISCFGMSESQAVIDKSPIERKIKQLYSNFQEAVAKAGDYINNTKGVFEWIDNGDGTNGGFNIFATNGTSLLRATAGGIGVSLDGGQTFQNAITRNGINASVIRTGTLNASDILIEQDGSNSKLKIENGGMYIYNNANEIIGQYTSSGLSFSNSGKIIINNSNGVKVTEISPSGGTWYDSNGNVSISLSDTGASFYKNGSLVGSITTRVVGTAPNQQKQLWIQTSGDSWEAMGLKCEDGEINFYRASLNLVHGTAINFFAGGGTSAMTIRTGETDCYQNLDMNGYSILNQSDIRLKKNVSATPVTALDTIDRMRFVEFDWKEDGRHDDLGLIAQELQKINPSMVVDTGEYLAVNTSKFIMYSLKAIQELSAEVKRRKEQKNG